MSDFDLYEGQGCRCGNDPGCDNCGSGAAARAAYEREAERRRERIEFAESCCGKCGPGLCYVDQVLEN